MKGIRLVFAACCALSLCMACNAAQHIGEENLLSGYNPGFEQTPKNGKIPGWTKSSYGEAVVVTDIKHSGKHSVLLSDNVLLTSEKTIKVEPGYTYHMSVWGKVKKLHFQKSARYGAGFGLRQFAQNKVIDGDWYFMQSYLVDKEGDVDWTFSAQNLVLKETTAYLHPVLMVQADSGTQVWFDDIRVWREKKHNPAVGFSPLPYRSRDTKHASVNVDCSRRGAQFISPLNAYDHHRADRLYSPTIGTAGPQLEGPNRWFAQRLHLGFKYVRIHDIYDAYHVCAVHSDNGKWKVDYEEARTHYPDSNDVFPPVYSLDQTGSPRYDFTSIKYLLDKVVLSYGCKPIIDLAGVPSAMEKPRHNLRGGYFIPSDFNKWEELNYQFVKFLVDTYGKDEVLTWMFETGNEPSTLMTFRGDPDNPDTIMEEFFKLQDYAVAGVTRALADAFIAGPSGLPQEWAEPMLIHCATGRNYATGKVGTKIDAISCHGYLGGTTTSIAWRQAEDQLLCAQGCINRYYRKTGKKLQLFNTEYTPVFADGKSDLSNVPHAMNNHIQAIATLHMGNFSHKQGVTLMAFFFYHPHNQVFYDGLSWDKVPEFTGLSTCTTFHGIFTPVCRAYEIMQMLNGGREVPAQTDHEPVYSIATATDKQIKVLCYSFEPNTRASYTTRVNLSINPAGIGKQFRVRRYELSSTKANSWHLAQKLHLTQADCAKDLSIVDKINAESELKPEDAGAFGLTNGKISMKLDIPAYSAVLLVFDRID